jgi:hypothetical protein
VLLEIGRSRRPRQHGGSRPGRACALAPGRVAVG